MRLLVFLLVVFAVDSCANNLNPSGTVIIGFCCGECYGKCFSGFLISDTAVYEVEGTYCNNIDTARKRRVDKIMENKVRTVLGTLPSGYEKYKGTIGCPDCHDQCAAFVSYGETSSQQMTIDPDDDKHPKELDEFVRRILELKLL